MKKISLALCVAGFFTFASADFLSVNAGVGGWKQNIDGYVKIGKTINYFDKKKAETDGNPNSGNFGLKTKSNLFIWAKFIHPIPILPNIKTQFTKYHTTGHSNYISGNTKIFGDVSIPTALTNADTEFDINSYDVTLFYEFKPTVADIEIGFGADYWRGHTKITGEDNLLHRKKTWVDEDFSVLLPYLYGHVETMKILGFSILVDAKYAKAGKNHHYDYNGALKYTINALGHVNPFIKVGYRYKEAKGKDGDNITQIKYKGIYAQIGFKF